MALQAREVAREHGLANVSPELCRVVSLGLEAHLGNLLRRAFVLARQRADVGRRLPGMEVGTLYSCLPESPLHNSFQG